MKKIKRKEKSTEKKIMSSTRWRLSKREIITVHENVKEDSKEYSKHGERKKGQMKEGNC